MSHEARSANQAGLPAGEMNLITKSTLRGLTARTSSSAPRLTEDIQTLATTQRHTHTGRPGADGERGGSWSRRPPPLTPRRHERGHAQTRCASVHLRARSASATHQAGCGPQVLAAGHRPRPAPTLETPFQSPRWALEPGAGALRGELFVQVPMCEDGSTCTARWMALNYGLAPVRNGPR